MAFRSIRSVAAIAPVRHGPRLITRDIQSKDFGADLNPFIVVSLYDMQGPTFPPHPHAGFSVATYILPESPIGFINQDSLGNRNRIAPGALHLTVAGRGVLHEEQPEKSGPVARGFQIWIDHPPDQREREPHALHARAEAMPTLARDGANVRVVLGAWDGLAAQIAAPSGVRVIDASLSPGATLTQNLAADENVFFIVLEGAVAVGDAVVSAGSAATFAGDGDEIAIRVHDAGARLTLFAGRPHNAKRLQHGPFVANDDVQLRRFSHGFQTGAFGALKPIAAQPDWAPNDGQVIP